MPTYLMPPDLLETTPSRQYGISEKHETTNRIYACELIAQAGIMLRLSQATINTAQILLHRFYYRKSMLDYKVLVSSRFALFPRTQCFTFSPSFLLVVECLYASLSSHIPLL